MEFQKLSLSRIAAIKLILKRKLLETNIKNSDLIVVQSKNMYRMLKKFSKSKNILARNIKVLPTSLPKINYNDQQKIKLYSFQLIYPCTESIHKRTALAIKSSLIANSIESDIGLIITTDKIISKDNSITQTGKLKHREIYRYYRGSKALLITSTHESLGLPLLEALAFNIPVIAPKLSYAEEILGDSACYYNDDNPEKIAKSILNCYQNYSQWKEKVSIKRKEYIDKKASMQILWEYILDI
tara:strand:+ start:95 stop:820 length:726 start_codon:yes stop_codon:yes gene_type:complete